MNEFVVGFKKNKEFDWPVAANFTIEGAGAATLLASFLLGYNQGMLTGLGFVILGVLILFLDLGNPFRFWRAIKHIRRAWISRGTIFISGMILLGLIYLVFPDVKVSGLSFIVAVGLLIFSFMTILYTGFLVASMTAIPFWNTPFIPVLFLFHASASGMSILIYVMSVSDNGVDKIIGLLSVQVGLLIATLFFSLVYVIVMSQGTIGSRESVRRLLHCENKKLFSIGAVLSGILIPMALLGAAYLNLHNVHISLSIWFFFAMVLRLIGDYYFRLSVLRAGVYEPILNASSE